MTQAIIPLQEFIYVWGLFSVLILKIHRECNVWIFCTIFTFFEVTDVNQGHSMQKVVQQNAEYFFLFCVSHYYQHIYHISFIKILKTKVQV